MVIQDPDTALGLVPEPTRALFSPPEAGTGRTELPGSSAAAGIQQSCSTALLLGFLNLIEGERPQPLRATPFSGRSAALEPAQQREAQRAALPWKLGRGLTRTALPGSCAGAQPGSEYRENRFPEVPRQWVGRSAGRWVLQDRSRREPVRGSGSDSRSHGRSGPAGQRAKLPGCGRFRGLPGWGPW